MTEEKFSQTFAGKTNEKNTPYLETERLILRRFTPSDVEAAYLILSDPEVNRFLPWFPVKNLAETEAFLKDRYFAAYEREQAYEYAICRKEENVPIGYIGVDMDEAHDFGYGLRKEFWHHGYATEGAAAVIHQLKKDGLPYITATHDRENPASGGVMKRLGMHYEYSYREHWMPKDIMVVFRMYQLNLDGNEDRVYTGYQKKFPDYFIEEVQ